MSFELHVTDIVLVLITLRVMARRCNIGKFLLYERLTSLRHHAERDEYRVNQRNISAIQFSSIIDPWHLRHLF